jgi:23S rRNA (pseudouridine1915-N3)-methyltransferase
VRITVVAAGKIKEKSLREVADDYLGRIGRYTTIREVETRDESGLSKAVPEGARLVALQVWGKQLTSDAFATKLDKWSQMGKGDVAFVIGAADGIPKELSSRAEEHLSLSTMTLPHRLARVILFEQIYRGFSILRGEPYAREG